MFADNLIATTLKGQLKGNLNNLATVYSKVIMVGFGNTSL